MAVTPGDLTSKVAELLELPLNTVKNYDRKLMEAGMRSKKGHGRGSATMTPTDAVSLLIGAACVGCEINKIASVVGMTRALPWPAMREGSWVSDRPDTRDDPNRDPELFLLANYVERDTSELREFGPAMDAIVGRLAETDDQETAVGFEITTGGGSPLWATIFIVNPLFFAAEKNGGLKLNFIERKWWEKKMPHRSLQVTSLVHWDVIRAVANLLSLGAA